MTDHFPLSDDQWQLFRARLEQLAEADARSPSQVSHAELGELLLILMYRLDDLEERIKSA